jgi:hypothetical protein
MERPAETDRATVVAWYGPKPSPLPQLIERLHRAAAGWCGAGFVPRPVPEVHATVLGLEPAASDTPRDRDGVLRHLVAEFGRAPFDVQFGGFAATDRRMLSRGQTLHERSLGLRGEHLVLIGWPMASQPTPRLGEIRRSCERFGFQHKYHCGPYDLDPDVYLVVGEVAGTSDGLVERLRGEVVTPVRIPLLVGDVALVEYTDPRLPSATSRWWPVTDLAPG